MPNGQLFPHSDFGTAEPSDSNMLPRHALTVSAIVVGVMLHAAAASSAFVSIDDGSDRPILDSTSPPIVGT